MQRRAQDVWIELPSPSSRASTTRTTRVTGTRAPVPNDSTTSSYSAGSTMAPELPEDFREFLNLLRSHGVEYLLIGGYAVGYHGFPRATGDMDIWIALNPANAERVVDTLREFGFDTPQLAPSLFLQEGSMVRMGNVPLRIEILTSISGVSFDECYRDRVVDLLDGIEVSIISLPHLKANKQASGRYKDLMDLEELP